VITFEAIVPNVTIPILIADQFLRKRYYRVIKNLSTWQAGGGVQRFSKSSFLAILVDRSRLELSSIFIDTLLHEATKKRDRNARRGVSMYVLFITAARRAMRDLRS